MQNGTDEPETHACGCVTQYVHYDYTYKERCAPHKAAESAESIKVTYGSNHKAYVSETPAEGTDHHYGVNKHSDEPVVLRWDDEAQEWKEV